MAVLPESGGHFDQNRTTLTLGWNVGDNLRLELGYLNQFSIRTNEPDRSRLFRFNHALQVYLYLEIGRKSKVNVESDPAGQPPSWRDISVNLIPALLQPSRYLIR